MYMYVRAQELEGQWQSANSRQEQLEAAEWDLKTRLGQVYIHMYGVYSLVCLYYNIMSKPEHTYMYFSSSVASCRCAVRRRRLWLLANWWKRI